MSWGEASQAVDFEPRNFELHGPLLTGFDKPAVIVDHSAEHGAHFWNPTRKPVADPSLALSALPVER